MIQACTLLLLALLQEPAPMSPEEEKAAMARGQQFLDKVAASWTGKLPQERLFGIYMGRQWFGTHRMSIKAAPAGSGAAFEVAIRQEYALQNHKAVVESKALLDPKLFALSGEHVETSDGRVFRQKLSTADGKWKVIDDNVGERSERNGTVAPGISYEANLLPVFVRPGDQSFRLLCLIGNKGLNDFVRQPETVERTIDGKKQPCQVLRVEHGRSHPDLWYFSEDGRPLEFRSEAQEGLPALRMRLIAESAIGKPLNEPLEVKPAERRVLDLFLAMKKNDATAVAACFDFDRFAKESIPDYAALPAAEKKKAATTLKDNITKNLLAEKSRTGLAAAANLLEEALAAAMKSEEKDGVTLIRLGPQQVWKLHSPADGPRKGQWLIFGVEE